MSIIESSDFIEEKKEDFLILRPIKIQFLESDVFEEYGVLVTNGMNVQTYVYPLNSLQQEKLNILYLLGEVYRKGNLVVKSLLKEAYLYQKTLIVGNEKYEWYQYENCFCNQKYYSPPQNAAVENI